MATDKEYKWERFWCPPNKNYMLDSGGFLLDPESAYFKYYDSTALRFEEIPDSPCLVLLGEPGIGKTKVLDDIYKLTKSKENSRVIRIDLRSYNTSDDLVSDLTNNPEIQDWINNNYQLTLFFDSLDECLLNVRTVAALLMDRVIKNWPYQRLSLRFVCRTIDWPDLLDSGLCSLYGIKEVPKYELLPLRRRDVELAASLEGIDSDDFLSSVLDAEVAVFANRPITLKFLLNAHKKDGRLPKLKSEIYWEGCLQLCEEKSKSRIASQQLGVLSPIERLIIASRIAVVVLLSKKSSISLESDIDGEVIGVEIRELVGFTENNKGIVVTVDENAIREVLSTGLFSSRGNNLMGFAHQTYAEFLAAYYLNTSKIPYNKASELILHSDGKVIPQLQEVAVWLSTFSSYFVERMLPVQPELILRTDVAALTEERKKILVAQLLNAFETKNLVDVYDVIRYLNHVNYSGIDEQLAPILQDQNKNNDTRCLAILIVRECKVTKLLNLLISMALNQDEDYRIRQYSAYAISKIGNEEEKAKLLLLALGTVGNDPQDELKGIGLGAVWPDHIELDTLLGAITPMKDKDLIGEYYMFLDHEFIAGIQLEHLPKVLAWAIEGMPILGSEIVMDNLVVGLMRKAWENIENPEIGPIFATLVQKRLGNYEEVRSFSKDKSYLSDVKLQPKKRRLLIELLVKLIDNPQDVWGLLSVESTIVLYDDLEWIVEKIRDNSVSEKRVAWAQILFYLMDRSNPNDVMDAYSIYETYPDISEIFSSMFSPILLDSELARSSREYSMLMKEREVRQEVESVVPVDFQGKMLEYVDQFDAGDSNAWWMLNWLFLAGEPNRDAGEFDADLTSLFLWNQSSDELKDHLITIAEKYLDKHPAGDIYTEDKHLWRPAISAFRAFYLIAIKDPKRLHNISQDVWNQWASVLLSYPEAGRRYDVAIHQNLILELFRNKDDNFYGILEEQIKNEHASNYFHILKLLEPMEAVELQEFLVSLLSLEELQPYAREELLRFLLVRGNSASREFALSAVSEIPKDDAHRHKRLAIARALIFHTNDAGWYVIKREIRNDLEFGETLFQSLAHHRDSLAVVLAAKISESEIADLFSWLEERFPAKNDPDAKGFHSVTERESVGQFRDSLIQVLAKKGTEQACTTLAHLVEKFPDKEWLLYYLRACERNFRQNTWEPLMPYEVLEIIRAANEAVNIPPEKLKINSNLLLIAEIVSGILVLILPNIIDYQGNSIFVFLKVHQGWIFFLILLSVLGTITLPKLRSIE